MPFRPFIDGLLSLVSPRRTKAGSGPALSATLTTTALNGSSLQRFASSSCSQDARGPPSSFAQLHTSLSLGMFVAHNDLCTRAASSRSGVQHAHFDRARG